jgi:hypothetical protein
MRARLRRIGAASMKDEGGAILILALVFILLMALSILGLLTFGGTGLKNSANLQGQRDLEYAADGAATAAIQSVRYSYQYYPVDDGGPTLPCLPDGATSMTIDSDTMAVGCTGTLPQPVPQQSTRVVTFYACLQAIAPCSPDNAIVAATVGFQDVSAAGVYDCSDAADTGTCGTGMIVTSWVVNNVNGNNT